MNPILRPKIPSSVRTLLTDIVPRDLEYCDKEEKDNETENLTSDGIKLPGRGVANSEELLAPAGTRKENDEGDKGLQIERRVCGVCTVKPSFYTCPRCNVPYCGLACYRSSAHSACSEEFYKESVLLELRGMGETEEEGRRKMQEILVKLSKEGESQSQAAEVLQEEKGTEDGSLENQEVFRLLSRLAEIQSSGAADTREIADILTNLSEYGQKEGDSGQEDQTAANHRNTEEDHEEDLDLAERFSGLDIESMSEERVWELLPQQDRERFEGLLKRGGIGGLVPQWSPWWERHEGGGALIELLEGGHDGEGQMMSTEEIEGDITGGAVCRRSGEETETERKEKGVEGGFGVRDRKKAEVDERGNSLGKCKREKLQDKKSESATVVHGTAENEDGDGVSKGKGTEPCEEESALPMQQGHQKKTKPPRTGSNGKSPSSLVPQVNRKIPPLKTISSQSSPLVQYSLVNVLLGYTATLFLFNGDLSEPEVIQEFCEVMLATSEALSSNRVFSSLQEATEVGTRSAMHSGCFSPGDSRAQARAVAAVAHILAGRSRQDKVGYTLAALSQLQAVLSQARGALPKEGEGREVRRTYFMAGKKCEFLQSWVKDNCTVVSHLAACVWREHTKMEKERKCFDRQKKVVEQSWKKGRGEAKGTMIEEMD